MKKVLLSAFAMFVMVAVGAQDFGLMAGYTNNTIVDGDSGSGFNVGAFAEFDVSEKFSVQPELVYTSSSIEDNSYNLFNVNVMAKYNVVDKLDVLAGPQIGFASGDIPDTLDDAFGDDFSSLNLQLAVGLAYDITENIFAQARYGFMLNDHLDVDGGEAQVNSFSVGVGYKF